MDQYQRWLGMYIVDQYTYQRNSICFTAIFGLSVNDNGLLWLHCIIARILLIITAWSNYCILPKIRVAVSENESRSQMKYGLELLENFHRHLIFSKMKKF